MRKFLLTVFLGLSVFLLGASCAGSSQSNPVADKGNAVIQIKNFVFNPATVTIMQGSTVTWQNSDSTDHQIQGNNLTNFESGVLGKNDKFTFTFDQVGVWPYRCTIHPSMQGVITVK